MAKTSMKTKTGAQPLNDTRPSVNPGLPTETRNVVLEAQEMLRDGQKPRDDNGSAPAAPASKVKAKAPKRKPGLAGHKDVLESLEHMLRTAEGDRALVLEALVKTLRFKMKRWAKVEVRYEAPAEEE